MESRWNIFKRSKRKKVKGNKGKNAEEGNVGGLANTISCGTSTTHGAAGSIRGGPAYHAPHPTGYRATVSPRPYREVSPTVYKPPPGAFSYNPPPAPSRNVCDDVTLPVKTRHDSLNDLSSCSESVVVATCLKRSRSQPSVNGASKRQSKPVKRESDTNKTQPKKSGLGSWLRKSLRRSKSKTDVSSQEKAEEDARDQEEYAGGADNWGVQKLTRSVSTSVVSNLPPNHQGHMSMSPGAMVQTPGRDGHFGKPRFEGRDVTFHSLPASRPYVLPLPPRPKHFSLPPTPFQAIEQGKAEGHLRDQRNSSIGLMRGTRNFMSQQDTNTLQKGQRGSIQSGSSPGPLQSQPVLDLSAVQTQRSYHRGGHLSPGSTYRPGKQRNLEVSQPVTDRPPVSPRTKIPQTYLPHGTSPRSPTTPGQKFRSQIGSPKSQQMPTSTSTPVLKPRPTRKSSYTNSSSVTSKSQSSDCPSSIAPSPPISQLGPRSPTGKGPDYLTVPQASPVTKKMGHPRSKSAEARSSQSPHPTSSLASSTVSSAAGNKWSRELPPLPPKRHSLASTILSLTTTESVYHQIIDENVPPGGRNYPGLPWRPPHSPVNDHSGSVDALEHQPVMDDFGYLNPQGGNPMWGLNKTRFSRPGLQRTVSHSVLDQVGKSGKQKYRHNPQFTDLDHVRSAMDLTTIPQEEELSPSFLNKKRKVLSRSNAFKTPGEPIQKSKSYHDMASKKESRALLNRKVTETQDHYRSQPEFGGPGIQSRESLAFKPLSHTSSDDTLSSCSSDSDLGVEERRRLSRRRNRRRPKRRSASYNNITEDSRTRENWPGGPDISGESSYMLRRWWATLDDIPTAVLRDGKSLTQQDSSIDSGDDADDGDVSMATTASYIPGVSLADKLRLAASKGQLDKVKELVAAGATFVPDREGRTALHYAALNGYAAVVSLLAAESCDINLQDTLGYTALHRAAAQGHLEVIRALLAEGCLVDRQDEVHGNAAIHEAAWNGYSRTLELLVKQRTHVSITNKAGFSALHLAAQNGHNQSARVLLYANCNADHKNNYGDTPLHTAARYGHAGVTRILISAKADVNQQNKNGDTALHIAAALKRRKITKLLCDSPIDVSIKNKQNETAVDVARRKEHPEIILAITSKPKLKVKKSRFGRSRSRGRELDTDTDRKGGEKKGFFFRKKKAKEKEKSNPALTAASEVSSCNPSAYADLPPAVHHLYRGREGAAASEVSGPQARGTSTMGSQDRVSGVLHSYAPKQGVKYYRDLAGNIKQGPVGYTAQCQCAPLVKRLETRVEADRANLYDHIDASHRTLAERIDSLDRRTAQQVYSIDKLTKERLEAERKAREEQMESRGLAERLETERQLELQADCVKTELKAWVDARVTGVERHVMTSHDDGCDYLLNSSFNFGRDGLHQTNLFRSKSDETLSVSSSHPVKRNHKISARAAHELRRMQSGGVKSQRHEQRTQNRRSGLRVHDRPSHDKPRHETNGRPLGHSPEGQSTKNESFSEQGPVDRPLPDWIKPNPAVSTPRNYDEAEGRSYSSVNALGAQLRNLGLSPVTDPSLDGETPPRPTPPLHFTPTNPGDQPPKGFTVLAQVHHAKTDSGSNPDSGYGGKPYTTRPDRQRSEQHDTSLATNISTTTDGTSATSESDPLHVTRHFFDTVSAQMEKWYERRLKEVEKKAEDRVKLESSAMQSRIQALEERFADNKVKLGPQIEASIGTQV